VNVPYLKKTLKTYLTQTNWPVDNYYENKSNDKNPNSSSMRLYSSALDLPAVEPETTGVDETSFPTAQWVGLFQSIKGKIRPQDAYWTVFDSREKEAPVQGSLAGDISETYYDLKQHFQLEAKGIPPLDFMWELRECFREHWGRHAIEALKAIQDLHL
jgi:hypothetical protein